MMGKGVWAAVIKGKGNERVGIIDLSFVLPPPR